MFWGLLVTASLSLALQPTSTMQEGTISAVSSFRPARHVDMFGLRSMGSGASYGLTLRGWRFLCYSGAAPLENHSNFAEDSGIARCTVGGVRHSLWNCWLAS